MATNNLFASVKAGTSDNVSPPAVITEAVMIAALPTLAPAIRPGTGSLGETEEEKGERYRAEHAQLTAWSD